MNVTTVTMSDGRQLIIEDHSVLAGPELAGTSAPKYLRLGPRRFVLDGVEIPEAEAIALMNTELHGYKP